MYMPATRPWKLRSLSQPPIKPVFRPRQASAEVNTLEHEWWNVNAPLIAKVWEMHDEVSRAARGRYLARARRFFASRPDAHVIELGCGSGWVGQSICGPQLRITGTDFSESQIELARDRAKLKNLEPFTNYVVGSSDTWPTLASPATGVLIHAFLHHLDDAELDGFFAMLHRNLPRGTQVWVYEPAFYATLAPAVSPPAALNLGRRLAAAVSSAYDRFDLIDHATLDELSSLFARAAENGWYLSPKEVPLEIEGFDAKIASHVAVAETYWANVELFGWVSTTNLLKSDRLRQMATQTVVRLLAELDRRVASDDAFLRSHFVAPLHGFRIWAGVLTD